jgi:hypothetical protein
MRARKLVIVFKDRKYYQKVKLFIRGSYLRRKRFPTTVFDDKKLVMIVEKATITDPTAIGIGALELTDSNIAEGLVIAVRQIRSMNRTSPLCFEKTI